MLPQAEHQVFVHITLILKTLNVFEFQDRL